MMDETTTRRGFLKGLGAAIALLTVAPPLIMQEAVAAAAVDPLYPVLEAGEIWLKVAKRWRLVGGLRTLSTHQDSVTIQSIDSPYTGLIPTYAPQFDAEIATDPAAAEMIRAVGCQGDPVDMLIGFMDYEFAVPKTYITSWEIGIGSPSQHLATDVYQWERRVKHDQRKPDFVNVSMQVRFGETILRHREAR